MRPEVGAREPDRGVHAPHGGVLQVGRPPLAVLRPQLRTAILDALGLKRPRDHSYVSKVTAAQDATAEIDSASTGRAINLARAVATPWDAIAVRPRCVKGEKSGEGKGQGPRHGGALPRLMRRATARFALGSDGEPVRPQPHHDGRPGRAVRARPPSHSHPCAALLKGPARTAGAPRPLDISMVSRPGPLPTMPSSAPARGSRASRHRERARDRRARAGCTRASSPSHARTRPGAGRPRRDSDRPRPEPTQG